MTGRDPIFDRDDLPVLPFANHSGSMGSELSRQRAEREDEDGTTTDRQDRVIGEIRMSGIIGRTWKDIAQRFEWHHGQATGALSPLHQAGHIAALATEYGRDGCTVYVTPDNVGGRETRAPGKSAAKSWRELAEAQKQQIEVANEYIARLEKDAAEAHGLADQANANLLAARDEYVGHAARQSTRITELTDQLRTMRARAEEAELGNALLRSWRRVAMLEVGEQELVDKIRERLASTTKVPTDTVPVLISTLQTLTDIASRLRVSPTEREQVEQAKQQPDRQG